MDLVSFLLKHDLQLVSPLNMKYYGCRMERRPAAAKSSISSEQLTAPAHHCTLLEAPR